MKNMNKKLLLAFILGIFLVITLSVVSAKNYHKYDYDYYDYNNYYNDHRVVYKRIVLNDYPYHAISYIDPYYYSGPEIYYAPYYRIPNYRLYYSPYYIPYNKPYHQSYYNANCYDCYPYYRSIKYYSPYENIKFRKVY